MLRYCHSSVGVGGGGIVQKLGHFLVSLSLLKMFTYVLETQTSCLLSKGEPIPVGEVTLKIFLM